MSQQLSREFLIQLANEFGTPLYVYHAEKIKEQYEKLQDSLLQKINARFYYACKALTNINVLKYVNSLGAGVDCVSIHEVKLALKAGFDPKNILYTPNCVDFQEIVAAKELGVNLNIDNISILEQFGNKFGGSYPVCIRLNPHIMAGGNFKISTGHVDSKFGISIHPDQAHWAHCKKHQNKSYRRAHAYGSEIKDIGVFMEGLEVMFEITSATSPTWSLLTWAVGLKCLTSPMIRKQMWIPWVRRWLWPLRTLKKKPVKNCRYGLNRVNTW